VAVTERMLKALEVELAGFSQQSIDLEHETARIIADQCSRGWLLQQEACFDLLALLKERKMDLEDEVRCTFRPLAKGGKEIRPKRTQSGHFSKVGLGRFSDDYDVVGGCFTAVDFPEFNLGSRKQIGEQLVRFGWKPKQFTETGQPIVDEGTLENVTEVPEAQLIAEYLMIQKRVAQVQSWLDAVDDDGRVRGQVNSNGANTGRMTHSKPNLAQVPASRSPYGAECRAMWIVPEGYKLVGSDAEGLELRCLAHYMDDPAFTDAVVNGDKDLGTDIHTVNMRAAGLTNRDQAKTFIYAFLYGAGDAKIGEIVGGGRKEGRELKRKFLERTPALARLRTRVEQAAARGWLKCIDGRKLHVRSAHSALNTLLQGAGAVIMKQALVILDDFAQRNKLVYGFVGNIHDEIQAEVLEAHAERFGRLADASIAAAGEVLGFRCPLAGAHAVGDHWGETH
jgi:DNA polymerase I-like protein with 3'-5' exonuclease and polymerase domains